MMRNLAAALVLVSTNIAVTAAGADSVGILTEPIPRSKLVMCLGLTAYQDVVPFDAVLECERKINRDPRYWKACADSVEGRTITMTVEDLCGPTPKEYR